VLTRDAEASDHAAASPVGMGGHGALSYPCTVIESVRANSPAAWTYGSGRVTLAVLGLLTLVNEDPAREAGTDADRRRVALLEAESCRAARRERPDLELLYGHAQQCGPSADTGRTLGWPNPTSRLQQETGARVSAAIVSGATGSVSPCLRMSRRVHYREGTDQTGPCSPFRIRIHTRTLARQRSGVRIPSAPPNSISAGDLCLSGESQLCLRGQRSNGRLSTCHRAVTVRGRCGEFRACASALPATVARQCRSLWSTPM
jgi:hypothetical protein